MTIKTLIISAAVAAVGLSGIAHAEGDAVAGEKDFKKCKACHMIANGDEVIAKGGKTGPNLYGVVGRQAGSTEGFKYGASIVAAGEAGLLWDEEHLVNYIADPKGFLQEYLDDSAAKAKMTFRMKGAEDVVAYLASLAPVMEDDSEDSDESSDDSSDDSEENGDS